MHTHLLYRSCYFTFCNHLRVCVMNINKHCGKYGDSSCGTFAGIGLVRPLCFRWLLFDNIDEKLVGAKCIVFYCIPIRTTSIDDLYVAWLHCGLIMRLVVLRAGWGTGHSPAIGRSGAERRCTQSCTPQCWWKNIYIFNSDFNSEIQRVCQLHCATDYIVS